MGYLYIRHLQISNSVYAKNYESWLAVDDVIARVARTTFLYHSVQGAPEKNNPLGKIRYLWNCCRFFRQIYSICRGGLEPHILRVLSQYLVSFKNYNYLNLNVHFLK